MESVCVPPTVCLRDLQSMISPQNPSYRLETKQKKVGVYLASSPPAHFRKQQKTLQALLVVILQQCGRDARSPAHLFFIDFWRVEQQLGSHGHTSEKGDRCSEEQILFQTYRRIQQQWGDKKAVSSLRKAFNKIGPVSEEITSYIVLHVCPDVCFSYYFN